LLVAALAVGVLLWLRLLYGLFSNAPPAKTFAYFDEKGQPTEAQSCSGAIVVDGPRLWTLCGPEKTKLGRFDVDAARVDLLGPIRADGFLVGLLRAGDDTYVVLNTPDAAFYRIGRDGRVEDLGAIDDIVNGFSWVNGHLEAVTGRLLPAIYTREGTQWKRRPIAYRDNECMGRSLELAVHEPAGWKFVVAHFSGPADAPLKMDIELGDESGKWETTEQLAFPARFARRLNDGTIDIGLRPLVDRSAGNLVEWMLPSDLPYAFVNGRVEPIQSPVADAVWSSNASLEGTRLVSVPFTTVRQSVTRIRDRWFAIDDDHGAVLRELAEGRRSPRAIAPMNSGFSLLPLGNGYLLVSTFEGTYARVGEDLRRSDPPNVLQRLRLLPATSWQKLILAVVLLVPLALLLARRSRRIEPLSLAYLVMALAAAYWVLPVLSRI
jgi:hypothetical protein